MEGVEVTGEDVGDVGETDNAKMTRVKVTSDWIQKVYVL